MIKILKIVDLPKEICSQKNEDYPLAVKTKDNQERDNQEGRNSEYEKEAGKAGKVLEYVHETENEVLKLKIRLMKQKISS